MPELLWKAYIDFEIAEGEFERTRELHERLLDRTKHLKVWISYAKFEALAVDNEGRVLDFTNDDVQAYQNEQKKQCIQHARIASGVFEKALNYYRSSAPELKEERAMLLEEWLNMEAAFDELGDVSLVQSLLPKKLKKRRQIDTGDGPERGNSNNQSQDLGSCSQVEEAKIVFWRGLTVFCSFPASSAYIWTRFICCLTGETLPSAFSLQHVSDFWTCGSLQLEISFEDHLLSKHCKGNNHGCNFVNRDYCLTSERFCMVGLLLY